MCRTLIKSFIVSIALLIGTSACVIRQDTQPVQLSKELGTEIVIIPKTKGVRRGFAKTYREALEDKGFSVLEKKAGTRLSDYPLASTYIAKWSWDVTTYMSYAEIWVYEYGKQIGHVIYKVQGGNLSLRPGKWKNAEPKIHELVDELFPDYITVNRREFTDGSSEESDAD